MSRDLTGPNVSVGREPAIRWSPSPGRRVRSAVLHTWVEPCVRKVYYEIAHRDKQSGEQHGPHDHRQVLRPDGVEGLLADTRDAEHVLDDEDAAEEPADVHAEQGHDRAPGIAHDVAPDDRALGEALGAGGLHEVRAQDVEHTAAQQARVPGGPGEADGEPWEDAPVDDSLIQAAQREDGPLEREEVHQEHAEEERRHAQEEQAEDGERPVAEAVLLERAGHADRDADEQFEEDAEHGDHDGRREALQDRGGHRELCLVAVAEVALHQVQEVEAVLLPDGFVQPQGVTDPVEDLGRRVRACDALGRVAGHGEGEQERDEAHEEEHHHHPEQPAGDVLTHPRSCSPCAVPRSSSHLRPSFRTLALDLLADLLDPLLGQHRGERHAHGQEERAIGLLQRDLNGVVVDDLEAADLLGLAVHELARRRRCPS